MSKVFVVFGLIFATMALLGIGHLIQGGASVFMGKSIIEWSMLFAVIAIVFEFLHQFVTPLPSWG